MTASNLCPRHPLSGEHCMHERHRETRTGGQRDSFMFKIDVCCWCNLGKSHYFTTVLPEGHGEYNPNKVWLEVEKAPDGPYSSSNSK